MIHWQRNLVVAIIVLLLVALFLLVRRNAQPIITSATPTPSTVTLQQARRVLLSKTKLSFPDSLSLTQRTTANLPQLLRSLIPSDALSIRVFEVSYPSHVTGYAIDFYLSKSIPLSFQVISALFSPSQGWEDLGGQRANAFAFIEAQTSVYQAQATFTAVSASETRASIQIITR